VDRFTDRRDHIENTSSKRCIAAKDDPAKRQGTERLVSVKHDACRLADIHLKSDVGDCRFIRISELEGRRKRGSGTGLGAPSPFFGHHCPSGHSIITKPV
jgi:hypothetical protein